MFKEPYLYYYLIASLLSFLQLRVSRRDVNLPEITRIIFIWVGGTCKLSCYVFLVLGFWFMPEWWYPLAFMGLNLAAAALPIPDKLGAFAGVILAPVFSILAYISLF